MDAGGASNRPTECTSSPADLIEPGESSVMRKNLIVCVARAGATNAMDIRTEAQP